MRPGALLLGAVAAAAAARAAEVPPAPAAAKGVVPGAFILELADGKDPGALVRAVEDEGATTRLKLDFDLFKGVSVQLKDGDGAPQRAARIAALPEVKAVWPVRLYNMPSPRVEWVGAGPAARVAARGLGAVNGSRADAFAPHVMTQVSRLRERGFTGKGMRIAVIDTGIDYKHPALGGCFGPGCLVGFGTDLVGDAYNGSNTPVPDADPMDCNGHGSHVAGIVAAQPNRFGFTGAAPDAELGAYRVFGCKGQVSNDVLIAAYNRAYQDGAHIITASIGGPSGWSEDPWAVAVSRIVDRGVPCTVSAGNEGADGLFMASGAADGRGVTAVASVDNTVTPLLLHSVEYAVDDGPPARFGFAAGEPGAWDGVRLDLYATSLDAAVAGDACDGLPDSTPDLSSRVVLVRRGQCSFVEKATNVAARGGRYLLVYNNVPAGATAIDVSDVGAIAAAAMTTADVGEAWVRALRAGRRVSVRMAAADKTDSYLLTLPNNATGGALSDFTTWGPTWEMDLKPQVAAPGGNILSTYPLVHGGYAVLSGTSMACPLAAAIVALVAQVRGTLDPALLESLLSASARPQLFNDGSRFLGHLAPAAQQGAGLVQAWDAAYATSLLAPSSLSFNDSDHLAPARSFTLSNTGPAAVAYRLSHVPAVTMYALRRGSVSPAAFPNEAVDAPAALRLSAELVKLGPGQSVTIDVAATPPPGLDARRLALWSGWIAVNGSDGSALSLPYQGLTGSLHDAQVLEPDRTWLAHSTDKKLVAVPADAAFALPAPGDAGPGSDLPALVVSLALGSPRLRADLVPLMPCDRPSASQPLPPPGANATAPPPPGPDTCAGIVVAEHWGVRTMGQPYGFPARWSSRGANPFPWDGRLDSGNYAPPGKYKFSVRALRIFGNAENRTEWDVSESPAFSIKYL